MAPGLVVDLHDAADTRVVLTNDIVKQPSITTTELITPADPSTPTGPLDPTLVLHPSTVTTDFDLLRFHAAAHDQLPNSNNKTTAKDSVYSTNLISSPYNSPGHFLSLSSPTLPLPSLLFAKALTALAPSTPSYATAPYTSALNFDHVLEVLRDLAPKDYIYPSTDFYVVVFRSKLKAGIDLEYLYQLDYESHREACESGGLLKYWFGKTDGERRNLATCFWHSREDAYKGGLGPWHLKARRAGRELYEEIVFGTWKFTIQEGAKGWECVDWA
ncbi:hypothetical protein IQ06DRAFT_210668 [Phaeosphaeriaceae sp. SRC1lsM3a]|nr:hypothetical protein IQ06DRAFT_210668 [Stagonospora sp. SRC1lsM3a]